MGQIPSLTGTLAAGFWHHVILVVQPEQAVLKVLWAVHPTAVKLMEGENKTKVVAERCVHLPMVHCEHAPQH